MPAMEASPHYLDPLILAKVQGLELRARLVVEGYLSGMHKSPYHGFSVEFAQHREYTPGDDIKHVDWKVYARTGRYFLKQHEEETNLACWILLDVSDSMRYGSGPVNKFDYAGTLAAALAYLILQQQDGVGLATFDDRIQGFLRSSSQPSYFKEILKVLDRGAGVQKTRMAPIFHEFAERLQRRGLVIVISDLFDEVSGILAGLRHLRHKQHEVILFHVLDGAELDFPFQEPTLFRGLEQSPDLYTDPLSVRRGYLAQIEAFISELKRSCREHDMDYVQLRTDASLARALSGYMAFRHGRRAYQQHRWGG
jgi:uncharacterized protein (DUF58 family)